MRRLCLSFFVVGLAACANFNGYSLLEKGSAAQDGDPAEPAGPSTPCASDCGDAAVPSTPPQHDAGGGDAATPPPPVGPNPVECYPDGDRDGVPKQTTPSKIDDACPVGWIPVAATTVFDCNDNDPLMKPGQTAFFAQPGSDNTYDYDCDDANTGDAIYTLDCSGIPSSACAGAFAVIEMDGKTVTNKSQLHCGGTGSMLGCKVSGGGCTVDFGNQGTRTIRCR